MYYRKNIWYGLLCICISQIIYAQNAPPAKKNPLSITGGVGASANFYSSNETFYSRPSSSWNAYGNFTAKVQDWSIPFSFMLSQYSNSHSSPFFQVGASPTYHWMKVHVGFRNIPFSPLTFEGQTFRGVGVELNPKMFRFAAFYGKLNKGISEDTTGGSFRAPQFSTTGYGVKVGIGNATQFFDLIYFHAKDDSSSASFINNSTKNAVLARENAVLGSSFRLVLLKKLTVTGDAAISGLIPDISNNQQGQDSSRQGLKNFIGNFLPDNPSLEASYAGQSSLTYYTSGYNSSFSYRRVQPNFKSLGTPYMISDNELLSWLNNFSLVKGKVNVSASISHQHNNLEKNLVAEMQTQVANVNINTILGQHFNVNLNLSGYNLKQKNGNAQLPDSLRLNDSFLLKQQIYQFNINPTYNFTKGSLLHYISGSLSLQTLTDKNKATAVQSNSNNLSTSINYNLAFMNRPYSFSLSYLFNRYKQLANAYTSNGATIGTSAQFLKNRSLNIQGNIGYFLNHFSDSKTKNISYSLNAGYSIKHHSFNLFANYIYTPPVNKIIEAINKTYPYAVATKNYGGGLSYNYSF
ncbi:MAG: hypothetical protein ABIN89_25675 [Chitinophagaceae bacterium]